MRLRRKWMNTMGKAIRLECFQNLANYRKPSSFIIRESFPLPAYSTVMGMIHAACGYTELHRMKLCIQGVNNGTISELYTRYSFSYGTKYEATRHQLCVKDDKDYGVFRGPANVELVCDNHMVIHIVPEDENDFDTIYQSLLKPLNYLSLGRYEDLLDIESVTVVNLTEDEEVITGNNIYIPVDSTDSDGELLVGPGEGYTVYSLTKEYEIINGYRRWKRDEGIIKAYHYPKGKALGQALVDDSPYRDVVVLA